MKNSDENIREFERKLIADWLRFHISEQLYNLIYTGDYRMWFSHGTLPDKNGNMFKPFEQELKAVEHSVQSDETFCSCTAGLVETTLAPGICGACHKPFRR